MDSFTALFDACVLYPAPLRDFLMRLALTGLFRARWTERIHQEWIESLLRRRPDLSREKLARTKEKMNGHAPGCLVEGYEPLEAGLRLPDEKDRHVLAAAIHCHAGVIVTYNLRDFPPETLEPFGIEAQHPDEFIVHLMDLSAEEVLWAFKTQLDNLKNPKNSLEELLATFEQAGLAQTVTRLKKFKNIF